ncbi:MAG: hypothetical protein ABR905_19660 [Terracidiphilus sp.]|jgi:hypothetical protein
MTPDTEDLELKDRLNLIENMIAEGRRTTESWGWTFVLWGIAYYVAILWTSLAHSYLAWPVTMTAACVLMGAVIAHRHTKEPRTTISRAIAAIWISMGISTFVLLMSLGFSGIADQHSSIAIVGAMLATANAASSIILKWKLQFACAMVWWALTVYACFGGGNGLTIAFLAAIFFCQIVFGIYGMIAEARRSRLEANHA